MVVETGLPLWWATAITFGLFFLIALGTWLLPRDKVLADAPDKSTWRDIRIWASCLIVLQLSIYWVFS
ncbi:MAG: hypothetical protein ACFHX7_08535 [Pseudomonadota bacterium]